jgi:L-threonylcarbamoyladenylate synthase
MRQITTETLHIDPVRPETTKIERAAALIRAGELVAFPTETVYGLGADALQARAVEGIFAAKGRPLQDPLIVHIADAATLGELTAGCPEVVLRLTQAFWPGPLTLILPRRARVPSIVSAGRETVAVRMPRHRVALALIRAAAAPIAAPSANRFMHVSPTTARHVSADLGGRIPLILDGGPCSVGVESTILDLCAAQPTILRPGGIGLEALRPFLPDVQIVERLSPPAGAGGAIMQAQKAPGQLLTHYAPAVPLLLFEGSTQAMRGAMLSEALRRRAQDERVGVLLADEDVSFFEGSGALLQALGSAADPQQVAAALFAGMRALEEAGVQAILCRSFAEDGLGLAIRDRLLRAASGNVFRREESPLDQMMDF